MDSAEKKFSIMSNKAAVLKSHGARLVLEERPIPQPQAEEILVKVWAIATNPVDWKLQDSEYFRSLDIYPTIPGSDLAGTVEAVGPNVNRFHEGDRVTGFADALITRDERSAAFQQYTIIRQWEAAKIPDSITFEEGSVLPMAIATAGLGIFLSLGIPRPPAKQGGGFIVWGASSSVGSVTVQIARSLGYTVFAVNSPRHNAYIKQLGAVQCFDYKDKDVEGQILAALEAAHLKTSVAYDAISEFGSSRKVASIVEASSGGGRLCVTSPWPGDVEKPHNVEIVQPFAATIATVNKEFSEWLFGEWLEKALADKTFVPSPAVQKVEGGLPALQTALDLHKKGVSGTKPVVPLRVE